MNYLGSGCGTVDSAVASNPRGPEFESSHRQPFIEQLFTVCRIDENKEKDTDNCPF